MLRGLYLLWKDHGYGVWRLVCNNSMLGHNRLSLVFPEMDGFLLEEKEMPYINMEETGKNIKKLLAKNNMTVKDIQMNLGFTTPYPVYKWINGVNMPNLDNLIALSFLFGVTMDEIIVTEKP